MSWSPSLPVVLFVLSSSLAAAAQESTQEPAKELPWRKAELRLGLFALASDTGLEVKSSDGLGASIDLEDALGLDESTSAFRVEGSLALGDRHRLHFDVFTMTRRGDRSITDDIQIGDTVFPVDARLKSESELHLYALTYGYSVLLDERVNLAITFGIHGMHSSIDVDAQSLDLHEEAALFLPIPLPGLICDVALTPDLFLRQRAEFIWIAVGPYSGVMTDLNIRLEYSLSRRFSAGVGFNVLHGRVESQEDDASGIRFEGSFEFGFSGLMLYAGLIF